MRARNVLCARLHLNTRCGQSMPGDSVCSICLSTFDDLWVASCYHVFCVLGSLVHILAYGGCSTCQKSRTKFLTRDRTNTVQNGALRPGHWSHVNWDVWMITGNMLTVSENFGSVIVVVRVGVAAALLGSVRTWAITSQSKSDGRNSRTNLQPTQNVGKVPIIRYKIRYVCLPLPRFIYVHSRVWL